MSSTARIWLALAGLAAGSWHGQPGGAFPWLAGAAAVGGGAALLRRRSAVAVAGLTALAFGLGWAGAWARADARAPIEALAARVPRCTLDATLIESAGGLGSLASVRRARCEGFEPAIDPGVVVLDGEPAASGGRVRGEGWLVPLGREDFDAARRALGARAYFDARDLAVSPPRAPLFRIAFEVRKGLERATAPLDPARAALLRGLAVGDTAELDPMVVESLRRSGLAHLVAVSGSNVAIVLTAVAAALRHIALWTRVGVALIALVLFAIVVGPEPSVLRAALMGGIGLVALVAGRRARPMNALGLALVVLVGARPAMVGSVGLHLSAAATAGIVAWSHPLAARLSRLPRPVALALGATLAAQVAVAPLVVGVFGRLSLAGPAANLVAAPAVPPATVLGLGAAVAGAVHAPAGRVAAWLAEPFVAWIMMVGTWFGAQEWSEVEMGRAWGAWLLLLLVAAAARTLVRRARG